MNQRTDLGEAYYQADRLEMLELLPANTHRVLELGCGEGLFGKAVKNHFGAEFWAMENDPSVAAKASQVLDRVLVGDADRRIAELPDGYFDAIVCNDVLEHLAYPWVTLERLRSKLRPDGVLVASIPNIRYLPALTTVLLRKDFPLHESGIFDRTHLRFFTRKSIVRMFETAGFTMKSMKGINPYYGPTGMLLTLLSFGYFVDVFYMQYACVASPRA
jgi:2-polyprenyl-3-methyl-5-hydroxy-6-metoxy-1,4-benzoquinol methylase